MNRYRFVELNFIGLGDYVVQSAEMTGEGSQCTLEIEKVDVWFLAEYNYVRGLFLDHHEVIHEATPWDQKKFADFIASFSRALQADDISHIHSCRCGLTKTCSQDHGGAQVIQVSGWDNDFPEFLGEEFVCPACAAKAKIDEFVNRIKELAKPTLAMRAKWRASYPDRPQPTAVGFTESELGNKVAELIEEMEKNK